CRYFPSMAVPLQCACEWVRRPGGLPSYPVTRLWEYGYEQWPVFLFSLTGTISIKPSGLLPELLPASLKLVRFSPLHEYRPVRVFYQGMRPRVLQNELTYI